MFRKILYRIIIGILLPTTSLSAVQGNIGSVSSGNIGININVPTRTYISEPTAISNQQSPDTHKDIHSTFCMTSPTFSATSANYSMQFLGQGNEENPHAFTVSNGDKKLSYLVYVNDSNTHLKVQAGSTIAKTSSQHGTACGINKTDISLKIEKNQQNNEASAVYLGALTFIMIPE